MKWLIALLMLGGCAPHLVGENAAGGTISMGFNLGQAAALKMADAECRKYGKVAESQGVNELRNSLRYRCISP